MTAPTDSSDQVGHELSRVIRVVHRLKQRADMSLLGHLVDKGPQRVGEIAAAIGTDPSTVSRQVAALVEAGLAERLPDPDDGRAHRLVATERGVDRCAEGRRKRMEMFTAVLAGWPVTDRGRLAELLGRFADDLQEWDRRDVRHPGGES